MAVPSRFAAWVNRRILKAIPSDNDTIPIIGSDDGIARRTTVSAIRSVNGTIVAGHEYHDDIQGILQTALTGSTSYTFRAYRSTGIVMPHIAKNDVFSMTFQMPHRKRLGSNIDSVHLHYIPMSAANGDIKLTYTWGWYNNGDVLPNTLPNSGSVEWTLSSADQYKSLVKAIITDLAPPANEGYSSLLYVNVARATPSGTDWGNGELALSYMDAHFATDRIGSYNEYND